MDIDAGDSSHHSHRLPMYSGGDYWGSRDMDGQSRSGAVAASPNPNDEDTMPTIDIHGRGPGRRAGHTATAVNRKIYVFGGSCGSDYRTLLDFWKADKIDRAVA
jgi:hypothetical protein